jgi:uncharacterized protein (DUF952 family)
MIYHVVTGTNWEKAQEQGFYTAPSLITEGFIHASNKEQVAGVLQRYYKDLPDLFLLHIDEQKLTASLKWELSPSINEEFPHIYGQLNLDAVVEVVAILK